MLWKCKLTMSACMIDKRHRKIEFYYDGADGETQELGVKALRKRLRKPYLWYGVGYEILTPLGMRIQGTFEDENLSCGNA